MGKFFYISFIYIICVKRRFDFYYDELFYFIEMCIIYLKVKFFSLEYL